MDGRTPKISTVGFGVFTFLGNAMRERRRDVYDIPSENMLPYGVFRWALPVLFPVYVHYVEVSCPVLRQHKAEQAARLNGPALPLV